MTRPDEVNIRGSEPSGDVLGDFEFRKPPGNLPVAPEDYFHNPAGGVDEERDAPEDSQGEAGPEAHLAEARTSHIEGQAKLDRILGKLAKHKIDRAYMGGAFKKIDRDFIGHAFSEVANMQGDEKDRRNAFLPLLRRWGANTEQATIAYEAMAKKAAYESMRSVSVQRLGEPSERSAFIEKEEGILQELQATGLKAKVRQAVHKGKNAVHDWRRTHTGQQGRDASQSAGNRGVPLPEQDGGALDQEPIRSSPAEGELGALEFERELSPEEALASARDRYAKTHAALRKDMKGWNTVFTKSGIGKLLAKIQGKEATAPEKFESLVEQIRVRAPIHAGDSALIRAFESASDQADRDRMRNDPAYQAAEERFRAFHGALSGEGRNLNGLETARILYARESAKVDYDAAKDRSLRALESGGAHREDLFKKFVAGEYEVLQAAEISELPPRKRGLLKKLARGALSQWASIPRERRIAYSAFLLTAGGYAAGTVTATTFAGIAGTRLARGFTSMLVGQWGGKKYEESAKGAVKAKEQELKEVEQQFVGAEHLTPELVAKLEKQYREKFEALASARRKVQIKKGLVMAALGAGTASWWNILEQGYIPKVAELMVPTKLHPHNLGEAIVSKYSPAGPTPAPEPAPAPPGTQEGTHVSKSPPSADPSPVPSPEPIASTMTPDERWRMNVSRPFEETAPGVPRQGALENAPISPDIPRAQVTGGATPAELPIDEKHAHLGKELWHQGPPHVAETAEFEKASLLGDKEGIWHPVKRQLELRFASDQEKFLAQYNADATEHHWKPITAEELEGDTSGALKQDILNRETAKLLVDQNFIKANGTETWIRKPGVHIRLDDEGKITIENEKVVAYEHATIKPKGAGVEASSVKEVPLTEKPVTHVEEPRGWRPKWSPREPVHYGDWSESHPVGGAAPSAEQLAEYDISHAAEHAEQGAAGAETSQDKLWERFVGSPENKLANAMSQLHPNDRLGQLGRLGRDLTLLLNSYELPYGAKLMFAFTKVGELLNEVPDVRHGMDLVEQHAILRGTIPTGDTFGFPISKNFVLLLEAVRNLRLDDEAQDMTMGTLFEKYGFLIWREYGRVLDAYDKQ